MWTQSTLPLKELTILLREKEINREEWIIGSKVNLDNRILTLITLEGKDYSFPFYFLESKLNNKLEFNRITIKDFGSILRFGEISIEWKLLLTDIRNGIINGKA